MSYLIFSRSANVAAAVPLRLKIWADAESPRLSAQLEPDLSHASGRVEFVLGGLFIEAEADDLDHLIKEIMEKIVLFLEFEAGPRTRLIREISEQGEKALAEAAGRLASALQEVR